MCQGCSEKLYNFMCSKMAVLPLNDVKRLDSQTLRLKHYTGVLPSSDTLGTRAVAKSEKG